MNLNEEELDLFEAAVRVNTVVMATIFGVVGGGIIWLATAVLLLAGGYDVGAHLSLLSIMFPGYEVSWAGAWIGLLWGALFGAIAGALVYRAYARAARRNLVNDVVVEDNQTIVPTATLLLSGNSLGMSLGAVAALQLFAATNYLVLRGTAHDSWHAALLSHLLPGYTVTFGGSILGAVELFALVYVACQILAVIYNGLVKREHS